MRDPGCLLCTAERVTDWHLEDEECWVADCVVCMTPMVVWRTHGLPAPPLEAALLSRLERIAAERYGQDGFYIDAERARGLMGVEELPRDQGMAFVWDEPSSGTFWMKDTPLPLSIAFWDADGEVIALFDMQPCTTEPCPTYGPDEPFIGAVEANLGWFEEHGVAVGDHVELEERAYA